MTEPIWTAQQHVRALSRGEMTEPIWTAQPHVRALIFDCDGTLADTMPVHYRCWVQALSEVGLEFAEPKFYALGGMSTDAIIRLLASEQGVKVPNVSELSSHKERLYMECLHEVKPIDVVVDVARWHHGTLPLAVGSGGERWIVEKTLTAIGALDLFDTIVGADDTERHKPEPDVFLEGARRLGIAPSACVVFEDTDLGLEAARRAGMQGIDIRPWRKDNRC
jgi:beta-phosphoglucomutase-like phosphatase (HAD superfamily)